MKLQRTPGDSSVLQDTVVTGTSQSGYTVCLSGTPHMTVHLDAVTEGNSLQHSTLTAHFQLKASLYFCGIMILLAEKCPEDMAVVWLLPPRCNDLVVPHSERASLNHRCSRNQEYTGQRVRCC